MVLTKMPIINLENLAFLGSAVLEVTFLNKDVFLLQISFPVALHVGPTSYFFALVCIYLQCKKLIQQGSSYIFGKLKTACKYNNSYFDVMQKSYHFLILKF